MSLDRIRMELGHLGERVICMAEAAASAVVQGARADLRRVSEMDDDVEALYTAILEFIRHLGTQRLSDNESLQMQNLVAGAETARGPLSHLNRPNSSDLTCSA